MKMVFIGRDIVTIVSWYAEMVVVPKKMYREERNERTRDSHDYLSMET